MNRPPLEASQLRRRIAHWEWLRRQWPDCQMIEQTARYIIRKHLAALSMLTKS